MSNSTHQSLIPYRNGITALKGGLLLLSWWLLFWGFWYVSWALLPYEAVPPARHPVGWEGSLHDLLEQLSTPRLLSAALVGLSILLFARTWHRNPAARDSMMKTFIRANLACATLLVLLNAIVAFLPLHLAPPPGYGYTIKFIVVSALVITGFFIYQFRAGSRSHSRVHPSAS